MKHSNIQEIIKNQINNSMPPKMKAILSQLRAAGHNIDVADLMVRGQMGMVAGEIDDKTGEVKWINQEIISVDSVVKSAMEQIGKTKETHFQGYNGYSSEDSDEDCDGNCSECECEDCYPAGGFEEDDIDWEYEEDDDDSETNQIPTVDGIYRFNKGHWEKL